MHLRSIWHFYRDHGVLLWESLRTWPGVDRHEVLRQTHAVANRSLLFVTVIMSLTGTILVLLASAQAQRLVGDLSMVGAAFLQLLLREFGPTIVALMVAAQYGAGVAAELAAMTITEQLDAMRMGGAEPPRYLVLPRILGGLLGMAPLAVYGVTVAFVAGGLAANYGFGVAWDTYADLKFIRFSDLLVAAVKSAGYGVIVPLVACKAGLSARGGAPGVGRATTQAVIGGSVILLGWDLWVGAAAHLIEGRS